MLDLAAAAVVAPLAAAAWAALAAAEAGRLSLAGPVAAAAAALLVVLLAAARSWRRRGAPLFSWLDLVTLAAVGLGVWRLGPAVTPWPAFLDASWYVNTGAAIGSSRSLTVAAPALDLPEAARRALVTTFADQRQAGMNVPADAGRGFHDVIYAVPNVAQGRAVPYHPPLFASWLAAWGLASGLLGSGSAVLPWALAYLLAAAAVARRAFGPAAAPVSALLLSAGPLFAYYGRTPYAEMTAGAMVLAGVVPLVALAEGRPRPVLAALSGLALGLAVLAKADAALAAGALVVWWLAARRTSGGWRELAGLAAGAALPALHGVLLFLGPSSLYVRLNGGGVLALLQSHAPEAALAAALFLAAGAALYFAGRSGRARAPVRPGLWLAALAVALLAVAAIQAWLAPEGTPPSMVRILAWALSPLGLWAAAVGLLAAAAGPEWRRAGPILGLALLAVPVVLAEPAVTRSLSSVYAARRLMPYALPVAAVLASSLVPLALGLRWSWPVGSAKAGRRPAGARAGRLPGRRASEPAGRSVPWPLAVVAVLLALLLANLLQASRPLLAGGEFGGGPRLAQALAAQGGQRDVYLFASVQDGSDAGRLAAMLTNLQGRITAVVAEPGRADALAPAVARWRGQGRRVLVVASDADHLPQVTGYETAYLDETSVVPTVLAPSPGLPPHWTPYELSVVIYELVPEGEAPAG